MRLILVDNNSREGVSEWGGHLPDDHDDRKSPPAGLRSESESVLAASDARYTLLLNTDMYFEPRERCVTKMVEFMDAEPDCGLSVCRLYQADGAYGHPARRFPSCR